MTKSENLFAEALELLDKHEYFLTLNLVRELLETSPNDLAGVNFHYSASIYW